MLGLPPVLCARSSRGASFVECLLVVALVALGVVLAFRGFGGQVRATAEREAECVRTFTCAPGTPSVAAPAAGESNAPTEGNAPAPGERGFWENAWSGTKEGVSDFVDGFVRGDYSDRSSWAALAGSVLGGELLGPVADARDWTAAASDVWSHPTSVESWSGLGAATAAFVPGVGAVRKIVRAGDEVHAAAHTAAELARRGERLGEGTFSVGYRDGDVVRKVIKDEVDLGDGRKLALSEADRVWLARESDELTKEVADALGHDIVPPLKDLGGGVLEQRYVGGKTIDELPPSVAERAFEEKERAIREAQKALGLSPEYPSGTFENGWTAKVDENTANFRFSDDGKLTGWFDPVAIFPPSP